MQNKLKYLVLALFIAACGATRADSTADNLTRIEAETLVLKAREKQLAVKALIAVKQAEIASKQAEAARVARPAMAGDPTIRSVEGIGPTLYATLQLENGSTLDVKSGDVLPNGMRIVTIQANEVTVETGKKRLIRLASRNVSVASAPPAAWPSRAAIALPPLSPLLPN